MKRFVSFAVAVAAALATAAHAQTFPDPKKPIRIIVPTTPAGGNDAMARIVAQKLNERLKQPVIVENKSGANGAIGSEFVAKAKAGAGRDCAVVEAD